MIKPASTAPEFANYLEKDPTGLHIHYTQWLAEKTGIDFSDQDEATKIVQLAVALYPQYQKSAENKRRRADEAKAAQIKRTEKPVKPASPKSAAEVAKRQAAVKPATRRAPARKMTK